MMADEEKKMAAAAEQAAELAAEEAGDEFSGAVEDQFVEEQLIELIDEEE